MSKELESYSLSVNLTQLKHGFVTSKKGVKYIAIPIQENYLTELNDKIFIQTDVVIRREADKYENYGFQVQKLPTDKFKELGAEKAKDIKLPYLGNLKIFKKQDAVEAQELDLSEEHSDLPF